ncbi:hypothetical protein CDL15_Pgr001479 [Punica granatum]|uniref:Uncharacterized protein n=1 Tax=Punica granatum TaxID=22663 RepID=A0A218WKN6_PUNGR|nr:hypothetical protein CDL15_Pgr001479 [Punica granatum]PKI42575.1 hypothetical protein CRG98_037020 [Punica granatum]
MEAVLDNKENIPPLSSHKHQTDLQAASSKKPVVGSGRPRKPLEDITHLFRSSTRHARSCSFPEISFSVVASRGVLLNARKRRAFDDTHMLQSARCKSLRMGFR